MNRQKGQVILILILIMTVALSIGLSIVQKSLVDVSTSSKVEQSSRAFSAAEAGVEKALQGDNSLQTFTDNSSKITSIDNKLSPCVPGQTGCKGSGQQDALEFPPIAKEDAAQVWLADPTANLPNCTGGTYNICYGQTTLDIYWGNSTTDTAAIELTLVYHNGTAYQSRKWYLDRLSAGRSNGFDTTALCSGYPVGSNSYRCYKKLGDNNGINNGPLPSGLMLIRVRLLYNSTSQPFAVQATVPCSTACSLPPQSRSITSIGVSGETQRKVNIFQLDKVVPPYFDYAIFSAGAITKQ